MSADDLCPSRRYGIIRAAVGRFGRFLGCSIFEVTGCTAAWSLGGVRINPRITAAALRTVRLMIMASLARVKHVRLPGLPSFI